MQGITDKIMPIDPRLARAECNGQIFNAQNLDRVYTAEDFTAYLSSLICNGILDTYRQCFAPTVKNLSVTFGTGKAWIDGHYFISDTLHTIDLSSCR